MATYLRRRVSRRAAPRLFGIAGLGSLRAACGPIAAPAAPTTSATAPARASAGTPVSGTPASGVVSTGQTPVAQQPKSGGTLRITDMDLLKLDGHIIYANGINISWVPYDRLIAQLGRQAICTISRHWNIGANAEGFDNNQYRQLANTRSTEPDAAKRNPIYDQLNDFLLDQQFVIVVTSHAEAVVSHANVQNVRWDLHGARRYADMWMA